MDDKKKTQEDEPVPGVPGPAASNLSRRGTQPRASETALVRVVEALLVVIGALQTHADDDPDGYADDALEDARVSCADVLRGLRRGQ